MFSIIRKGGNGHRVLCISLNNWRIYLFWWWWDPKNKNFGIISKAW